MNPNPLPRKTRTDPNSASSAARRPNPRASGRALLLSLTLGLGLAAPVGFAANPPPNAPSGTNAPACCRKELSATPPTEGSLYLLESRWTSDLGKTVRLGQFQGRPVVATMFFSTCQFACPLLVQDLKRLEAALPPALREEVIFVLVSFDTELDTPAALAAYRERHSLDPARWCLLTGRAEDVRELAAVLGISYAKDVRGQFMHSNILSLLDRKGEVRHQEMGLNRPMDALLGMMARLDESRATASAPAGPAK